jgi:dihydroorotase
MKQVHGSRDPETVLRGGIVYDGSTAPRAADVAIAGERVAWVATHAQRADGSREIDARGLLVVPGLVDLHVHAFAGVGESGEPDALCVRRGTTTAVDGGSAGALTFGALRRVAERSETRLLAWLNLSTIGLVDTRVPELVADLHMDVDAAINTALENSDMIVGFKVRLSTYAAGTSSLGVLKRVRVAAESTSLPVLVHVGDTAEPLEEILEWLRPGDVVTHVFTGRRHGILSPSGRVLRGVREAQRAGVSFDVGRGRMHLSLPVARAAISQGFLPDTISTDITGPAAKDLRFSLPSVATFFFALGVPVSELISRMTTRPALAIGRPALGMIEAGGEADLTLLRLTERPGFVRDTDGRQRRSRLQLEPVAVMRRGAYRALAAEVGGAGAGRASEAEPARGAELPYGGADREV